MKKTIYGATIFFGGRHGSRLVGPTKLYWHHVGECYYNSYSIADAIWESEVGRVVIENNKIKYSSAYKRDVEKFLEGAKTVLQYIGDRYSPEKIGAY